MNAATSSQMLLAPWRQRDRASPWGRRGLLLVMLLCLAVSLHFAGPLWPAVLAGSAALALASLWLTVIGSLLLQNHPHAARFVPGHARQLREAALLAWGLASLGSAALLWLGLPRMPSFAALLLGLAASLLLLAWVLRNWVLWLVFSIAPALFFGAGLDQRLAPLGRALQWLWAEQTLAVLALGLLMLAWGVARLFGDGDAAHIEGYACRQRMRRAARDGMGGKRDSAAVLGRPGEWMARPFERAASAWLRHVLARAAPGRRNVMRRAEIVLHGQQHWLRQALGALLGLGLIAPGFMIAFGQFAGVADNWKHGAYGMAIGLASMGFNPSFTLPNMLWQSRREQALLRLLPGMPQGRALNRAVAWQQLRHALVAWTLTTVMLTLLAWAAGDLNLLCLSFAGLPLCAACLLRVPARMKPPTAWTAALPILAFMLGGWGLYVVHLKLGVPLAALGGLSVALSLALGLWRWRRLDGAPMALPAGRLA